MALSVQKYPSSICPAKNPVVFEITTSIYTEPGVNQSITFTWGATDELVATEIDVYRGVGFPFISTWLIFTDGALNQPYKMPVRTTESFNDWLDILVDRMRLWVEAATVSVNYNTGQIKWEFPYNGSSFWLIDHIDVYHENESPSIPYGTCDVAFNNGSPQNDIVKANHMITVELWRDALVFIDNIYPVISGGSAKAMFDVSELLLSALKSELSEEVAGVAAAAIKRPAMDKPFRLIYWESFTQQTASSIVYTSPWFYSLNGGVPQWKQIDFFSTYKNLLDYFTTTKRVFLTWVWFSKALGPDTLEKIYLLNMVSRGVYSVYLVAQITEFDNTVTTYNILLDSDSWNAYEVAEIDVSIAAILGTESLISIADVAKYSVWCKCNNVVITEVKNYTLDHRVLPNVRNFAFLNTLGAFEMIRFTGEFVAEDAYKHEYFDQTNLQMYSKSITSRGQVSPEITMTAKVNTGWISLDEALWMRDFLMSTEVYELVQGKRYPVLVTQDKVEVHRDNAFLRSITISLEYPAMSNIYQIGASSELDSEAYDPNIPIG